ncbi:MAG: hypothetical protein Q4E98_08860 [Acidaminococcaceae bacterium]|nr:hypothetical protein [Acidaminococcaceae bacterium]
MRQFVGLRRRRGIGPQFGVVAVVGLCAQPAAEGDADAACVAPPGVAFAFGQAGAAAIDRAVGVDVQVIVVVGLSIAACRPVQIDLRNAAPGAGGQVGELHQ